MSALAIAFERFGAAELRRYVSVWDLTFSTLYYREELSPSENEALRCSYLCMRLKELVAK